MPLKTLGIIVARGSSKRLPRKNVRPLLGVPMMAFMCAAANGAQLSRTIVSTEDEEIAQVAQNYGVEAPFRRPAELAGDWASSEDIVLHAVQWMQDNRGEAFDAIVLMQPTTPFVTSDQITACAETLQDGKTACCFTAVKAAKPPEWMFVGQPDGTVRNLLGDIIQGDKEHSQLLTKRLIPTGAAYAVRLDAIREQQRIICDPARVVEVEPRFAVDVDDEIDLQIAEATGRFYGVVAPNPVSGRT